MGRTLVAGSGRAAMVGLTFITNLLLAAWLDVTDLGTYFLITSAVVIFAATAQLGIGQAVVKAVGTMIAVDSRSIPHRLLSRGLVIVISSASVLAFVFVKWVSPWVGWRLGSNLFVDLAPWTALWGIATTIQAYQAEAFRSRHKIGLSVAFGGLAASALTLTAILWIGTPAGGVSLQTAIMAHGASAFAVGFIGTVWLLHGQLLSTKQKRLLNATFWHIAGAAWLSTLLFLVIRQIDIWILGFLLSEEDVGIYGFAVRFSDVVTLPLLVVNMVAPPVIATLYAMGRYHQLQSILQRLATGALSVAAVLAILVIGIAGPLSSALMDYAADSFTTLVSILVIGQLVAVATGSCGTALLLCGAPRAYVLVSIGTLGILMLSPMVVRELSAVGMALMVSIALVTQNVGWLLILRRRTGMNVAASTTAASVLFRFARIHLKIVRRASI